VIVPPSPGVLCAYGDATTSLRNESARTFIRRFGETSDAEVAAELAGLAADAQTQLDAEGVDRADQEVGYQVDVRYHGQGFEVPVDVDLDRVELAAVGAAFDVEHERLFTFASDAEHELVNLRAVVTGRPPRVSAPLVATGDADPAAARTGETKVYVQGAWTQAQLYDRALLAAGNVVPGPAVITEMDSTTLVLPGHAGTVDAVGSILIRPIPAGA
jgi:N-methylhydantoinase A